VSGDASTAGAEQFKYQRDGFTIRFLGLNPSPPILNPNAPYEGTFQITSDETLSRVNGEVLVGGLPSHGHGLTSPSYIKHFHIIGDTLELSFTSAFSSNRPFFFSYMEPKFFTETWPPSADIYFRMLDQSGVGDAFDTIPARFDLSKVRGLYREKFGHDGPVMLNLHSFTFESPNPDGDAFVRARIIYDPHNQALNWAPTILQVPPRTLSLNSSAEIPIHYYDPNGTDLALSVDDLPENWHMSYDPYFPDQLFILAQTQNIGLHRIRFIASDGDLADTMYMEVTVTQ
jgi:hypothetical protein